MAKVAKTAQPKEFCIPVDLLKTFQNEVRFVPGLGPHAGWITFDMKMLTTMLRSNDFKARAELAKGLEQFGAAGGELVMMDRMTGQI
jgi:hypothetical protein